MSEIRAGVARRARGFRSGCPEGRRCRRGPLARAFVRLADTLVSDFDIVEFLHGLSVDSVGILRAEAAGVDAGRRARQDCG